jgi:hypothetical protein
VVDEYIARKRLAKLGFWSPWNDLPADKAEHFLIIEAELERLKDKRDALKKTE